MVTKRKATAPAGEPKKRAPRKKKEEEEEAPSAAAPAAAAPAKPKGGALAVGATVPDVKLTNEEEQEVSLQACGFKDRYEDITSAGYEVCGMSYDKAKAGGRGGAGGARQRQREPRGSRARPLPSQSNWKAKHSLPFHLLTDDGTALRLFGATKGPKGILRRRGSRAGAHVVIGKGGKLLDVRNAISPGDSSLAPIRVVQTATSGAGQEARMVETANGPAGEEIAMPRHSGELASAAAAVAAAAGGGVVRATPSSPRPRPREPDVQLQIGNTHLDTLSVLPPVEPHKRIHVEISHVSAWVPIMFSQHSLAMRLSPAKLAAKLQGGDAAANAPKSRQILFDINGCVRPGEVLALMGPSGSGKTSLLSIMGSRAQKMMRVEGEVTFNGAKLTKRLRRQVDYVLQDDLLYEALTVHETLYYAAMLRLPRGMPAEERVARIDMVIEALGLGTCRDTIIGGFFRKGISGGERKRTSIGHELLINPSCIMLDEPTSGLDSTTSMHLLQILRHLASGGRAIVTTIHQPSSRLYAQLDKLMLLSQGHAMFYGHAQQVDEWFSRLGFTLPYRVNVADFILDLASGDVVKMTGEEEEQSGEESRRYLIECSEAFLRRHPMDGFDPERGAAPPSPAANGKAGGSPPSAANAGGKAGGPPPSAANAGGKAGGAPPSAGDDSASSSGGGSPRSAAAASMAGRSAAAASGRRVGFSAGGVDGVGVSVERMEEGAGGKLQPVSSTSGGGGGIKHSKSWRVGGGGRRVADAMGSFFRGRPYKRPTGGFGVLANEPRWGAPYPGQISILFRRSLRTRRFETLSNQDLLMFAGIAVIAGLIWLQTGQHDTLVAARNTIGLLFFLLMFLSFRSLFVALFTFPDGAPPCRRRGLVALVGGPAVSASVDGSSKELTAVASFFCPSSKELTADSSFFWPSFTELTAVVSASDGADSRHQLLCPSSKELTADTNFFWPSFTELTAVTSTSDGEYKHMLKERSSGMYRLSAFYIARTMSELPMDLLVPSVFFTVVYFMGGLRYNAGAFFGIFGTRAALDERSRPPTPRAPARRRRRPPPRRSLLSMLVAQSLGLLLGAMSMNVKTSQSIATVLMLTIVLTGGFFVVNLPAWIAWLKWLSYIYYALEIILYLQFDAGAAVVYRCTDPSSADACALTSPSSPETDPNCSTVDDIRGALGLVQNVTSQGDVIRDAFVLLVFLVATRLAVYVVLRHKTSGL
eukprot:scaffold8.g1388.t1